MSGLKATAGPWLIHSTHRWIVPAGDAFKEPLDALPICQLRDPDERLTEDQTLENGFLIAASPDLLAACEALVECFIKRGPFDEPLGESEQAPSINAGIAAIRKARAALADKQ